MNYEDINYKDFRVLFEEQERAEIKEKEKKQTAAAERLALERERLALQRERLEMQKQKNRQKYSQKQPQKDTGDGLFYFTIICSFLSYIIPFLIMILIS